MTTDDDMELVHGSGNVFRDLNLPNPELEQLRAILAAEIIKELDERKLTVRAAQAETGVAASEFSRIRKVNLTRFTVDRLMNILDRIGREVEITVTPKPEGQRRRRAHVAEHAPA